MSVVQVWTDGSSARRKDGQGFDGSWAFVAIHGERRIERYQGGFWRTGTISAMELGAIYAALTIIKPTGLRLQIFSDSKYSVNVLNLWHRKWTRHGWTTATGKPVEHRTLIQATLEAIRMHRQAGSLVEVIHVKGHLRVDGVDLYPENARADALASHARRTASGNTKEPLRLPGVTTPPPRRTRP